MKVATVKSVTLRHVTAELQECTTVQWQTGRRAGSQKVELENPVSARPGAAGTRAINFSTEKLSYCGVQGIEMLTSLNV